MFVAMCLASWPSSVAAALAWGVDDTCAKTYDGTYFTITGPAASWYIHNDPASFNDCHLYNATTTNSSPTHTANYYLPNRTGYSGRYVVEAFVNCEHNDARMKYRVLPNGTSSGSYLYTATVSSACDQMYRVLPSNQTYSLVGYVTLLDNTGQSLLWQNADYHLFYPCPSLPC